MTTRQRFIVDTVETYMKNHKEEYEKFLKMMEWRRGQLADKKRAELDVKEIRKAMSVPEGIWNVFSYVFDGVDEPSFGDVKGEMKWFVKKFPQFLLPVKY